ncbi:AEC family transporter [Gaetbulibacter aestuarii]|uniref:Permease n=1 Tax=Gaetbulibacter aestuarii TaxID=1502358 RepID=A0ABW7N0S8_9FLAO
MTDGLLKALSFILFIVIGILLKRKFTSKDEVNGLKKIILLLALPATIFIALLKIHINLGLFLLPFLALGFNILLYFITPGLMLLLGVQDKTTINTTRLLVPSLAPGLSCFPFILEFLGQDYLAKAAMADLGNKFFVLLVLYLLALRWYLNNQSIAKQPTKNKITSLVKTLLLEPINAFIIVALILLGLGFDNTNLPEVIQEILNRLSVIMAPLVLIFIGLSVRIQKTEFLQIFSLLMLRAALTVFIIGSMCHLLHVSVEEDILLYLVFGLSACSFWPFAHICGVADKELELPKERKTFNMDFALAILTFSLPLSVILILGILTAGDTFAHYNHQLKLASVLFLLGIASPFINYLKKGAQVKDRYKAHEDA